MQSGGIDYFSGEPDDYIRQKYFYFLCLSEFVK